MLIRIKIVYSNNWTDREIFYDTSDFNAFVRACAEYLFSEHRDCIPKCFSAYSLGEGEIRKHIQDKGYGTWKDNPKFALFDLRAENLESVEIFVSMATKIIVEKVKIPKTTDLIRFLVTANDRKE